MLLLLCIARVPDEAAPEAHTGVVPTAASAIDRTTKGRFTLLPPRGMRTQRKALSAASVAFRCQLPFGRVRPVCGQDVQDGQMTLSPPIWRSLGRRALTRINSYFMDGTFRCAEQSRIVASGSFRYVFAITADVQCRASSLVHTSQAGCFY